MHRRTRLLIVLCCFSISTVYLHGLTQKEYTTKKSRFDTIMQQQTITPAQEKEAEQILKEISQTSGYRNIADTMQKTFDKRILLNHLLSAPSLSEELKNDAQQSINYLKGFKEYQNIAQTSTTSLSKKTVQSDSKIDQYRNENNTLRTELEQKKAEIKNLEAQLKQPAPPSANEKEKDNKIKELEKTVASQKSQIDQFQITAPKTHNESQQQLLAITQIIKAAIGDENFNNLMTIYKETAGKAGEEYLKQFGSHNDGKFVIIEEKKPHSLTIENAILLDNMPQNSLAKKTYTDLNVKLAACEKQKNENIATASQNNPLDEKGNLKTAIQKNIIAYIGQQGVNRIENFIKNPTNEYGNTEKDLKLNELNQESNAYKEYQTLKTDLANAQKQLKAASNKGPKQPAINQDLEKLKKEIDNCKQKFDQCTAEKNQCHDKVQQYNQIFDDSTKLTKNVQTKITNYIGEQGIEIITEILKNPTSNASYNSSLSLSNLSQQSDAYNEYKDLTAELEKLKKEGAGDKGIKEQHQKATELIKQIIKRADNPGYVIFPGAIGLALGMKPDEISKKIAGGLLTPATEWPGEDDLKKMQTAANNPNQESTNTLISAFNGYYENEAGLKDSLEKMMPKLQAAAKNPTADSVKELDRKFTQYFKVK